MSVSFLNDFVWVGFLSMGPMGPMPYDEVEL